MMSALVAVLLLTACSRAPQGPPQTLGGVVKDAAGKPVAGAFVRVSSVQPGQTILVVSQADGAYRTPMLPAGSYVAQAFAEESQSAIAAAVNIKADAASEAGLTLNIARSVLPPDRRLTNDDYSPAMPEGEGKQLIISHCIHCHYLDRIVPTRHTPEQWAKTVERMSWFIDERPDLWKPHNFKPLTSREYAVVLDYLSKNFGMDRPPFSDPNATPPRGPTAHLPHPLQDRAHSKVTAVEFDFGAKSYEAGIDSQGNLLISEEQGGRFGRIDGQTLDYAPLTAPAGAKPRVLAQIAEDAQKNLWILDNGPTPDAVLLRYTPSTKQFQEFPIAAPPRFRSPLNTMRFVGNYLWATGNSSSRVIRMDITTGEITAYPTPKGSHPYGIAIGGAIDGEPSVWTTGNYDNAVNRVDTKGGKLITYRVNAHGVDFRRMGSDAEGNLWVGAQDSNKLFHVDYRTGEFTEYDVPTPGVGPYGVDVDRRTGLVWFSEREGDAIASFDPKSVQFHEYPLPTKGLAPRRVFVDPVNPRRIWWSGVRVGFIEFAE